MIRVAAIVCVLGVAATAAADDDVSQRAQARARADELAQDGNDLGRQGQLDAAIVKFKQAYKLFPRALYACNLGLAYVRKTDWARAHSFLSLCRSRWDADEGSTLQPWVNQRIDESVNALRAGAFGQVRVTAQPADAEIRVSAFSSDEVIAADRVVWLPQGEHTLTVSREGYVTRTQTVDVARGQETEAAIALEQEAAAVPAVVAPSRIEPESERGPLPWIVLGSGAAAIVAGGVFHAVAMGTKSDAEEIPPGDAFEDKVQTFKIQRALTVGLYGVGAAAVGVGLFLMLRSPGSADEPAPIGLSTDGRGATVVYETRW